MAPKTWDFFLPYGLYIALTIFPFIFFCIFDEIMALYDVPLWLAFVELVQNPL